MATAAVAIAMRKVTSHLMSNNAVGPETAVAYVPDRPIQRRMLARLIRRGVVVETAPDRYYLDVPAYDRWRRSLRRRCRHGAHHALGALGLAAVEVVRDVVGRRLLAGLLRRRLGLGLDPVGILDLHLRRREGRLERQHQGGGDR